MSDYFALKYSYMFRVKVGEENIYRSHSPKRNKKLLKDNNYPVTQCMQVTYPKKKHKLLKGNNSVEVYQLHHQTWEGKRGQETESPSLLAHGHSQGPK